MTGATREEEELCELMVIDSGASVHVCPRSRGQENGLRHTEPGNSLLTAWGAELKQHGRRKVSYETDAGTVTTDYCVLDVRRPIWSLESMIDSGCDVHLTNDRSWIAKDDGKELDMIRSSGVFFVAARPTKSMRDSETAVEIKQAALARENATSVRIKVPTGPGTPTSEERSMHEASGHMPYRSWCQWCVAARAPGKTSLANSGSNAGGLKRFVTDRIWLRSR